MKTNRNGIEIGTVVRKKNAEFAGKLSFDFLLTCYGHI